MSKQIMTGITLTCVLQNTNGNNVAIPGLLSDIGKGKVLFEETIPRKRTIRNSRLYEGKHLNIVRRKDGLYYPFLKAIDSDEVKDKSAYVLAICNELNEALNSIF